MESVALFFSLASILAYCMFFFSEISRIELYIEDFVIYTIRCKMQSIAARMRLSPNPASASRLIFLIVDRLCCIFNDILCVESRDL